jgi:hypothetical protein
MMTPGIQKKSNAPKSKSRAGEVDLVFGGPLLFVPEIHQGGITSLEIFSPSNGHPVGAVFLPGIWFSDDELNDPECERWPEPQSFSLLDPHSYSIEFKQSSHKATGPLAVSKIPKTNHRVSPGRRLSGDWEVSIQIRGRLSGWSSERLFRVTEDLYVGADAPLTPTVASMHRLTYSGVTAAEFCGAQSNPRDYLRANAAAGGTLIVVGEIPYQSTLLHERCAIDALARLAGLDLHLAATDPAPHKARLMNHFNDCGHSVILA